MSEICNSSVAIISTNREIIRKLEELFSTIDTNHLTLDDYLQFFPNHQLDVPTDTIDEIEFWGSKWQSINWTQTLNDDDDQEENIPLRMEFWCESAYTPAQGFWEKMAEHWGVLIQLEYWSEGENIAGIIEWDENNMTSCSEMSCVRFYFLKQDEGLEFWENLHKFDYQLQDYLDDLGYELTDYEIEELKKTLEQNEKL